MDATLTLVLTLLVVGALLAWWARSSLRSRPPAPPRARPPERPRQRERDEPAPAPLPPPMSEIPRTGPRRQGHVPSPVGHGRGAHPPVGEPPDEPPRSWAERFDLPGTVRDTIGDPDDPVELVRAILVAGGRPADVDGEVVRSGDHFVAVIGARTGRPALPKVLNDLYLRFRASGATDGVVICLRHLDPNDVHRRELLAPDLLHDGPDAIQRMADALARGEDPMTGLLAAGSAS